MKTLIYILILLLAANCVIGQNKPAHPWRESGTAWYGDTTIHTYSLTAKDSLSYVINAEHCKCDFYLKYGSTKHFPCTKLIGHYIMTLFWQYQKEVTETKGKIVKTQIIGYRETGGMGSFVSGSYSINGKLIQPEYIFIYNYLRKVD